MREQHHGRPHKRAACMAIQQFIERGGTNGVTVARLGNSN
jgi:hypothetical protein